MVSEKRRELPYNLVNTSGRSFSISHGTSDPFVYKTVDIPSYFSKCTAFKSSTVGYHRDEWMFSKKMSLCKGPQYEERFPHCTSQSAYLN